MKTHHLRTLAFGGALLTGLAILAFAGPAAAKGIANPDPNDPSGGIPPTPPKYTHPANGFDWRAKNRYPLWHTAWRSREEFATWPSETYDPRYVNPTTWKLTVMGCQTANDFAYSYDPEAYKEAQKEDPLGYPGPTYLYRWKRDGKYLSTFTPQCYGDIGFPAEGLYYVTLEVKDPATQAVQTWTNPVEVKDFLIVVLGDSSASGEGAPDTPVDSSSTGRAKWEDNRCHRSGYAGGALAASRIEDADLKTSVTFLSFACSGATLATETYNGGLPDPYENEEDHEFRGVGMTAPYAGIEPTRTALEEPDFSDKIPSQVNQLWNALTNFGEHQPRRIDALIVAGGINDARFADLATICVLFQGCPTEMVGEYPDGESELDIRFSWDVARVPIGWDLLAQQLAESRLLLGGGGYSQPIQADTNLALQYPPFFHDDEGDRCSRVLHDSLPWWAYILYPFAGWDYDEIGFADEYWAVDLDEKVREGAERNGFTYVDTISNRFFLHGICADDNWINTPTESAARQGDDVGEAGALASLFSKGSAHPNPDGYWAYSDEILRHLSHLMKREGNDPPLVYGETVIAAKGLPSVFNVLDNDVDPDASDVLAARVTTQPDHGTVAMQKDGKTTYKPKPGFLGDDQFLYEVTDGTDVRYAIVRITVIRPYKVETPVIGGVLTEIGGLFGAYSLEPPYTIAFDKPLRPEYGTIEFDEERGVLRFLPPRAPRRTIKLPYTVYSRTPDVTSPSYGSSMRGTLVLRVLPAR